jgi:hypothetical protein
MEFLFFFTIFKSGVGEVVIKIFLLYFDKCLAISLLPAKTVEQFLINKKWTLVDFPNNPHRQGRKQCHSCEVL